MTPLTTIEDVQAAVRAAPAGTPLLPRGCGTKPALSTPPPGAASLDLSALTGVLEYEPTEYTFTALAGTPLSTVNALLAEHHQYLPFDPPLAEHGATLGGTLAAGLSGPGRYRYGGARDFLVGVRFVDGAGRVVRGGSKVVKNAAGFDLPKLLVGSLGGYGALVELSFKVFPRPEAFTTVRLACAPAEAVQHIHRLYASQLDIDSLDYEIDGADGALWVRLGGLASAQAARREQLRRLLGGGDVVAEADEAAAWQRAREFTWATGDWALVKIPLNPGKILHMEAALAGLTAHRRYSAGGQVLWLATPAEAATLHPLLAAQGLAGLMLRGPAAQARLGAQTGASFARRVKQALDPEGRFVELGAETKG